MAMKSSLSLILLSILLLVVSCSACDNNNTHDGFKGIFIFGDDSVDPGNNNGVLSFCVKANFLPYGVDFIGGPSGRYTNGRNVADCVADLLKLPYPPPIPGLFNQGVPILGGINFASSGTGISKWTGHGLIGVKHMCEQIDTFKCQILPELKKLLNCKGQVILPNYLFMISTGTNDYASWYILKQYMVVGPEIMASMLIDHYYGYLKTLYSLGARKFLLVAPFPVGCQPGIVKEQTQCIKFVNDAVDIFHDQLISMAKHSKQDMPNAEFSILNTGRIIGSIVHNATIRAKTGIKVVDCACCDVTLEDTCKNAGRVCLNRKQFLYFDGLHTTSVANAFLAAKAFGSTDGGDVCPVNLQKLAKPKKQLV